MELPDWVEATDNISEPCGSRLSGDLTGFGRCVTRIKRADTANERTGPVRCQNAHPIEADGKCWTRSRLQCNCNEEAVKHTAGACGLEG